MARVVSRNIAVVALASTCLLLAQGFAAEAEQKSTPLREPDVIFVPTPNDVVDKMLELADVKKTDVLYDLGCGDGRIVIAAATKVGCQAVGYDINPQRVEESRENVKKSSVEKLVKIEEKDIFTLDLSPANVVTLYLLPKLNVKLIPQLKKLKPGSRIVSHDFDMKGIEPDKVVELKSENGSVHTIFLWTTPLKESKTTSVVDVCGCSSSERARSSDSSQRNRAVLECRAPTAHGPIMSLFSLSLAAPVSEPTQADLCFFFDSDDCAGGAIVGHRDEKGWLFPIGKYNWQELRPDQNPLADGVSTEGITPITKAQEGNAFWVKTASGRLAIVRIDKVQAATYDEVARGKTASVEFDWMWRPAH